MADDELCPVCGGPLLDPAPIEVCGGCKHGIDETGAISVTTTAEFAAVTPSQAAAILSDGPPRPRGATMASCTWCGKGQGTVKKLLSGGGAHICNECVALCSDILLAELGDDWR